MAQGIPAKYAFLGTVGSLPRVITHGLTLLGTNEVPGRGSNPTITAWRDELNRAHPGLIQGYSDDSVPWCGLFVALVCHRAGKPTLHNPLWARNWVNFGEPVATNHGSDIRPLLSFEPDAKASLGDVLVFVREGGGHVGFYIAEDGLHYHVLGGNQGDSVTITRVAKARCIGVRRPPMTVPPESMRPYVVSESGEISTNEA